MADNAVMDWECPYCGQHQAVVQARYSTDKVSIDNDASVLGPTMAVLVSVVCANKKCRQMQLTFHHYTRKDTNSQNSYGGFKAGTQLQVYPLLPESRARPLPDYIPQVIEQDYTEACRIRDLSPKASATLARRCLQGMIRDFCGISKKRLVDEIDALGEAVAAGKAPPGVQADTLEAIDHVRKLGNIGAHMEADINLIVDIDPDEAQTLIGLLELLFDEWYVSRHQRQERLKAIGVVAANKEAAKKQTP